MSYIFQRFEMADNSEKLVLSLLHTLAPSLNMEREIKEFFHSWREQGSPVLATDPNEKSLIAKALILPVNIDDKENFLTRLEVVGILRSGEVFTHKPPRRWKEKDCLEIVDTAETWIKNIFLIFSEDEWQENFRWRTDLISYYSQNACGPIISAGNRVYRFLEQIVLSWLEKSDYDMNVLFNAISGFRPDHFYLQACTRAIAEDFFHERTRDCINKHYILEKASDNIIRMVYQIVNEVASQDAIDAMEQAYGRFHQSLDLKFLSVVEKFCSHTRAPIQSRIYNWIASTSSLGSQRRCQALQEFPNFFTEEIASDRNLTSINQIVDQALPLLPAIAERLQVTTAMLRSTRDMSFEQWRDWINALPDIKILMAWFPQKWWPSQGEIKERNQWSRLTDIIGVSQNLLDDPEYYSTYSSQKQLFLAADLCWKKGNFPGFYNLRETRDMVQQFTDSLLLPALWDQAQSQDREIGWDSIREILGNTFDSDTSIIESGLTSRVGLMPLYNLSEYWHRNHHRIQGEITGVAPGKIWPSLFHSALVSPTITAIPLCSGMELLAEGAEMFHCVGSYVNKCLRGESHIISLRENGKSLSTIELKAEGGNISLLQHRGSCNQAPPEAAQQACRNLLAELESGGIKIDWQAVKQYKLLYTSNKDRNTIIDRIGYNPALSSNRDRALDAWKWALSKRYKQMSWQEWADELDIPCKVMKAWDSLIEPSRVNEQSP